MEGPPLSPQHRELFERMGKIEDHIVESYKTRRNPEEARKDALEYAITQRDWLMVEPTIHPNMEEKVIGTGGMRAFSWDNAIKEAEGNDNWQPIKQMIQSEAQTDMQSSAGREQLKEKYPATSSEEEELSGLAFSNLAASLDT